MHEKALKIKKRLVPDSLSLAIAYDNLGNIFQDEGHFARAKRFREMARKIEERLAPRSLGLSETYENLGSLNQKMGDFQAAARVLSLECRLLSRFHPLHSRTEDLLWTRATQLLNAEELATAESQNLRLAVLRARSLQSDARLIHLFPDENPDEEKILQVLVGRDGRNASLIVLLMEMGLSEEAFSALCDGRARLLRAYFLLETRSDKSRKLALAFEEAARICEQLDNEAGEGEELHEMRLNARRSKGKALENLLSHQYEKLGISSNPFEAINEDSAALAYLVTDETTYIFVARHDGAVVSETIRKGEAWWRTNLQNHISSELDRRSRSFLYEDKLLPPKIFEALADAKRVIVLPDSPGIWGVPFEEFLNKPCVYSLALGSFTTKIPTGNEKFIAVKELFGAYNPDGKDGEKSVDTLGNVKPVPKFHPEMKKSIYKRLDGLADSVGDVAKRINAKVLSGPNAAPKTILELLPRAKFAEITTHGEVEPGLLNASLLLHEGPLLGRLHARDILNIKTHAWIFLLCCNSAGTDLGESPEKSGHGMGEGPMGMAYAFLRAGAPVVIASVAPIWTCDIEEFHRLFFDYAEKGESAIDCLHKTKQEIRNKNENFTRLITRNANPLILLGNPNATWAEI